jgi:hypothetical protein
MRTHSLGNSDAGASMGIDPAEGLRSSQSADILRFQNQGKPEKIKHESILLALDQTK